MNQRTKQYRIFPKDSEKLSCLPEHSEGPGAQYKDGHIRSRTAEKLVRGVNVDSTVSTVGKHRSKKRYPGSGRAR